MGIVSSDSWVSYVIVSSHFLVSLCLSRKWVGLVPSQPNKKLQGTHSPIRSSVLSPNQTLSEPNPEQDSRGCVHYRKQWLCCVPQALDKAQKTLDKGFAEYNTRQTAHDIYSAGKRLFAECFLSGTRQILCQELKPTLGEKK